jgi:hypothetical protein
MLGLVHERDSIYCNKWKWYLMTFTTISDDDNIIDCNKWHFNRFLNPWLRRIPTCMQWDISYKYQSPDPLTHSSPYPSTWTLYYPGLVC